MYIGIGDKYAGKHRKLDIYSAVSYRLRQENPIIRLFATMHSMHLATPHCTCTVGQVQLLVINK